ncbi:MAG: response regulator, partial [Ramlibacter sp.]|nr:response regulator [Ramlibacter sp.]
KSMGRAQDAGAADAAIRVMVVDDNLDALETLEALLTLYGFDVMTASTPEQALQQSTAFAADAYVLDIGLPGMDGYELAAALRHRAPDATTAAQFIALTGYGQEGDKARALNAGFHIHLTKPANIENLLTALRDGPSGAGAHKGSLAVS